jgi:hypothetical protein
MLVAVILAEGGRDRIRHSVASKLYKAVLASPGGREEDALPARSIIWETASDRLELFGILYWNNNDFASPGVNLLS